MRILIVEDDSALAESIAEFLELQGAECDFAYNGTSGVVLASNNIYDIIILDLMLPKLNGIDACSEIRRKGCNTPILMLTAMDADSDQLSGFRAGIDDYVVKPCPMPLLWARLAALHRRVVNQSAVLKVGPLTLNRDSRQVSRENADHGNNKQLINLTPTAWKILELLMQNSPKVISRQEIEHTVWPDQETDPGKLNVHLHSLRKAVDKPFSYSLIKTVTGIGISITDRSRHDDE